MPEISERFDPTKIIQMIGIALPESIIKTRLEHPCMAQSIESSITANLNHGGCQRQRDTAKNHAQIAMGGHDAEKECHNATTGQKLWRCVKILNFDTPPQVMTYRTRDYQKILPESVNLSTGQILKLSMIFWKSSLPSMPERSTLP